MLLTVNPKTRFAERKRTERLSAFDLDERALQDILFKSLDRLFPDDELIPLMQSRRWQEEPDLMQARQIDGSDCKQPSAPKADSY